jgi:hypothetical protein
MGMFKDMRDLQKMSKDFERPSLKEGLAQAKEAVAGVQQQQALAQELANDGVQTTATIKGMEATGKEINHQPEMKIDMSLESGGDISVTQPVSPAMIGSMQPGAQIPVTHAKDDSSKLLLGHL